MIFVTHELPVNVPGEPHLVHSLEHGFIVLWYQRNLPQADVDKLKDLTRRYSVSTLLVPRDSIGVPVAATAWHQRLLCPGFQETPLVKGTGFQKEIVERWNRWEKLTQKQLTQRLAT